MSRLRTHAGRDPPLVGNDGIRKSGRPENFGTALRTASGTLFRLLAPLDHRSRRAGQAVTDHVSTAPRTGKLLMQHTPKRNAVLTLAFSGVFYAFFMHIKHAPGLGNINPFAVDPYDATGSLALILSGLLALLGVFRAFFPSGALIADEMRSDLRLRWQRPIAVIVVSVVLLAIYPDAQDRGLITALLAIVAGVL